jgi:AraC-like DNA-binding protein
MHISTEVYKRIVSTKLYIDDNFHEEIDLHLLSREACLSKYHFHRLFTQIYKKTPHRYLTQKRIHQAEQLLADGNLSLSDVCSQVGFESTGSFSILFKKEKGSAPQFYRNRARQNKELVKSQPQSFIPHCVIEMYGLDK